MALVGYAHLLLDVVRPVDEEELRALGLAKGEQCLSKPEHADFMATLGAEGYTVSAGGCEGNTIRCAKWLRPATRATLVGRVGADAAGARLTSLLENEGVRPCIERAESGVTGQCAVLVVDGERTMMTDLGANLQFTACTPASLGAMEGKYRNAAGERCVAYTSAYLVNSDPKGPAAIAEKAREHSGVYFAFSLGATWCAALPAVVELLSFADVVFGNAEEFLSMVGDEAGGDARAAIALAARKLPGVLLAMTRGSKSVLLARCFSESSELEQLELLVPPLSAPLVDDTGAGDSFVAGFLTALIDAPQAPAATTLEDMRAWAEAGIEVAALVCQLQGFGIPEARPSRS